MTVSFTVILADFWAE